MLHRDLRQSGFLAEIVFLGLAFLYGSAISGCKGSTSDFAKKQQAQENATAALVNFGAKITRLNKDGMNGWSVDLSQVPFTSQVADQLRILEYPLNVVNLSKTSIVDSQLAELVDQMILASVVELDLSHNQSITDKSLDKLEHLTFLRDLNLTDTQVTKVGIARLREKRQPVDLESDNSARKFVDNMSHKHASEILKREFNIRH